MSSPFKTVAFHTLGCKLNYSESSTISRNFTNFGYSHVAFHDFADVYVINTCSVTDNSDKKTRKLVKQIHKRSPEAVIAVIGCYAQLKPDEIAEIPGVNIVLGVHEKFNLPYYIKNLQSTHPAEIIQKNIDAKLDFKPSYSIGDRTRTFLKIQDGCDYPCTYCTIPLARGKSRSGSIQSVIEQAHEIVDQGIQEIVLTGVNIGDFGDGRVENFLKLLQEIESMKGLNRIRISSIEPNLLDTEIIQFISTSLKILPHLHIPLQSGSNKILQMMKRRYKRELYEERVGQLKSLMPNVCIGADVIVGFPGEMDQDFLDTYHFLHGLDVNYLHVFTYSERENTEAIQISQIIEQKDRTHRRKLLHQLSQQKRQQFYLKHLGEIFNVLFETYEDGILSGFTENYIRVEVNSSTDLVNKIIQVRLTQLKEDVVRGEILN